MKRVMALPTLLLTSSVLAQTSASFRLAEHVFNEGGHPEGGTIIVSSNFRVSLDSIGENVTGRLLSSASFNMDASLGASYPPPDEVSGVLFTDHQTLEWNPEKSVGVYNLYRGLVSGGITPGFGSCQPPELANTTATDAELPPLGDAFFYIVTAENHLDEEGTKGFQSDDTERHGASCP